MISDNDIKKLKASKRIFNNSLKYKLKNLNVSRELR